MISCLPKAENIHDLQKSSTPVNEKSESRAGNTLQPSSVGKLTPSKRGEKHCVYFESFENFSTQFIVYSTL